MSTFIEFCNDHGVIAPSYIEPGRWIRVPTIAHPRKKNGVVKISDDGRAGWCRDWATMETPALWKVNGGSDYKANEVDKEMIAMRQRERVRMTTQASEKARAYWNRCRPLSGVTGYLEAKGLTVEGCAGIRVSPEGETVVPMMKNGIIVSVQRIAADGSKKFWTDAPTKGASFMLARKGSTLTIFTEGFATAATLYCAVASATVIVTFSANNLPLVVEQFQPRGLAVIAADNDHETMGRIGKNPGMDAAQKAAEICGAGVSVPDAAGSDFNDLFQEALRKLKDDDMLSKFKKRPEIIRKAALAQVASVVMKAAKFIPYS